MTLTSDGKFEGLDYSDAKIELSSTEPLINSKITETVTAGVGSRASAQIDFTGKTADELIGKGIYIDGDKIDFYDSSNGTYKGDADFAVDLKGAGNSEAIVDKIVKTLHDGAGVSKLSNVYATKTEDTKLLITAKSTGISGNSIAMGDNFARNVSNLKGTDKIEGEEVVSANGLKDGTHTVTVTYNVAHAANLGATTKFTGVSIIIPSETTVEDGTYRLIGTAASSVKIQKMDITGAWQDVAGTAKTGLNNSDDITFGDITIESTYTAADINSNEYITFKVDKQHYAAKLTEQDGTAGEEVKISSKDSNVELKAQDGTGSAVINVGEIKDTLVIGASTKFTFETTTDSKSEDIVGGKFEASFQIGANTGQSMTIEVEDMRSQALKVSSSKSKSEVTASNGAKASYVNTATVSNGIASENIEFALDLSTSAKASAAISVLNDAIESVSTQRSSLGSFQNRLEHTIKNLETSAENLQASESRIRDVDMAKEMMEFTKNNILTQAAQAMLAQANQAPQGVLQLLR